MRVKRTAAFCMGFKGVMVKPGLNSFSEAESKVLQSDPAFQEQIDLGNQSIVTDAVSDTESLADAILKLNAKKAAKTVKEVLDIDVLNELLEHEERASVVKAVENQIAMLKAE